MRKDQVKLSELKPVPPIAYGPTFNAHMLKGDKSGSSHTGLHLIENFRKDATKTLPGLKLTAADIVAGRSLTGRFTDPDVAATVQILEVDLRARTFRASVDMYGTAKTSSFFPVGTDVAAAKGYIAKAWADHCTYGLVDIYVQMRKAFGLNWVGQATIGGQEIWVGASLAGPLVTAFPAVNNKFFKGG